MPIIYEIQGTEHRLEVSNEVYELFEEERKYQERIRKENRDTKIIVNYTKLIKMKFLSIKTC